MGGHTRWRSVVSGCAGTALGGALLSVPAAPIGRRPLPHPLPAACPLPARSARSARSDGTTTMVCLIGELMKHAERYIADGLHPRIIAEVQAGRKCGREGGREDGCVCVCSEGGGGWA